MDFEDILRRWDKLQKQEASTGKAARGVGKKANAPIRGGTPARDDDGPGGKPAGSARKGVGLPEADVRRSMENWIALHGVSDKDAETNSAEDVDRAGKIREAERLRRVKPQAVLDLHGRKAIEAQALLAEFLASGSRMGLDKVLVIHGKGLHSNSEPIMSDLVRSVLEGSDLAGSFGPADKEYGGRGATWVLIRKKSYFSR